MSLPGYTPPIYTVQETLVMFFGPTVVIIFAAFAFISYRLPSATLGHKLLFVWFLLCGGIHCFVEGYFGWTWRTIVRDNTFGSAVWKEYGKSDSRYLTGDPFVVAMETFTAVHFSAISFFLKIIGIFTNRYFT